MQDTGIEDTCGLATRCAVAVKKRKSSEGIKEGNDGLDTFIGFVAQTLMLELVSARRLVHELKRFLVFKDLDTEMLCPFVMISEVW